MAWPIFEDHYAAIVRFHLRGDVEKTFSNTFYFQNNEVSPEAAFGAIQDRLNDFYTSDHGSGASICNLLSVAVDNNASITIYDLGQSPPRVPHPEDGLVGFNVGSGALPHETCVCLSIRGNPPHTPKKRGRLFIGPLSITNVLDQSVSDSGPVRAGPQVASQTINTLVAAANALRSNSPENDVTWKIFSQTAPIAMTEVTGGWVDRDFDTQRRRSQPGRGKVFFPA